MRGNLKSAFTLFETLIVIALIGAFLALGIANFAILPSENMKTPKGFLAEALKQARMDAQQTGVGISMYYDEDGRDIVACFTETGAELWRINLLGEKPRKAGEEDARTDYEKLARQKITLKFFPVFPEQVTFSSGSSSSSSLEIPAISFHPDSGSTPVRIVLKVDGQDEITHIPDPFSGYGFTSKSPSAGDSQ